MAVSSGGERERAHRFAYDRLVPHFYLEDTETCYQSSCGLIGTMPKPYSADLKDYLNLTSNDTGDMRIGGAVHIQTCA